MSKTLPIQEILRVLELPMSKANFLNIPYRQAVGKLEKFKREVEKQRRFLAKKYHPDVSNDSGVKMKEVNGVVDLVL